jgi:hypothetical protein
MATSASAARRQRSEPLLDYRGLKLVSHSLYLNRLYRAHELTAAVVLAARGGGVGEEH